MIKFSKIDKKYGCLSNFYPCQVNFDGMIYPNSECAWQSLKTVDYEERKIFTTCSAAQAKRKGRSVVLRKDWETVKYYLMVDVCLAKFSQNEDIRRVLESTGDELLIENTTGWHDNIWGNCECEKCKDKVGLNLLGKALMEVRSRLKNQP